MPDKAKPAAKPAETKPAAKPAAKPAEKPAEKPAAKPSTNENFFTKTFGKKFWESSKFWLMVGGLVAVIAIAVVLIATRPTGNNNNGDNGQDDSFTQVYTDLKEVDVNGMTVKEACAAVREAGWKVYEVAGKNKYSNKSDCSNDTDKVVSTYYYKEKYYTYDHSEKSTYEQVTLYYNDPVEESTSSSSSDSSSSNSSSSSSNSSNSSNSSSSSSSSNSSNSSSSSSSSSSTSSTSGYESIYNTYAARLRKECPNLSISECAEIETEGVGKMAEYMWKAKGKDGQYSTYEEWAGKLFDVYMDSAQ